MAVTYYTLRIEFGSSVETKKQVQEITNLEFTDGTAVSFRSWRSEIARVLYTTGTAIEDKKKPGSYEFISPLRIHTAYLIKQTGKI